MRFSRSRYVTVCQQFLVTATVAAVGLSAAGVMTLQIVTPDGSDAAPAIESGAAYVDTAPIKPRVSTVAVPAVRPATKAATPVVAGKKVAAEVTAKPRGYATVGVTWKPGTRVAEEDIVVQVRTRKAGTWSEWATATYHDEHGPDAGSVEASKVRPGTDAVVVGAVDSVQVRAATRSGKAPQDLKLAVVDPGTGELAAETPAIDTSRVPSEDQSAASAPVTKTPGGGERVDAKTADIALAAMAVSPKPQIFSRAQWGADERLRDKSSLRYGTIKAGFIHHTVNANNYTPQQVPALLRGIYAYHTQSRGWSDIGYNFLVDRFGRIWEGRYGGVNRPVVGAHTLGYNEYAFAMSAIGDFDKVQPPQAMLDAYAKLFAWKLSLYDIPADGTRRYVKDRFLNAINGHRDAGQTDCPGQYLYAKISTIRKAARAVQETGKVPGPTTPTPSPTPTPTPTPTAPPTNPTTQSILPPPGRVPAPSSTPLAAFKQPAIRFPARTSLTQSAWPDLAVTNAEGRVIIMPGGGIRGFDRQIPSAGGWASRKLITVVGDVTGDKLPDVLALTTKTGVARVFAGKGDGRFSNVPIAPNQNLTKASLVLGAGDVTGDGRPDLVSRDAGSDVLMLHRGLGKGVFGKPTPFRRAWPFPLTAMADLNRDGHPDLIALRSDRSLLFAAGTGETGPAASFARASVMRVLPRPVSALMAGTDATGDQFGDLIVRWSSGRTSILAGNGKGGLGREWGQFSNLAGLSQLSAGAVAGNGALDVVGRTASGQLVTVPNNGRSNFGRRIVTNLVVTGATQLLSVGDWTGDGRSDLIARDQKGDRLVLWAGRGDGTFARGRSLGRGWAKVSRLAAVGDVTGDGRPDLVGRVGTGPLLVFPGYQVNGFKQPRLAPERLRTFNQIGRANWGAEGLLLRSGDRGFVAYAGKALVSALRAANGSTTTTYDRYVGVGDANGDAVADVLAREKGTGTLWLLPGKTSGGFSPRVWVATGYADYRLLG